MSTAKTMTTLIAGLAALTLLGACAPNDPEPTDPAEPTATQEAPPADPTPGEAESSPKSDDDDKQGADIEKGFAAVELAESETSNGKAISLDWDDDGHWKVDVIEGKTEREFTINADGTEVIEVEDDDADSDDVERLSKASVSLTDAVRKAMGEVEGTLDTAELDEVDSNVAWEVEIDTPEGDDVSIYINAASGEVLNRG
ncbi:PepSY domain-containing protein [Enemella sp. A6]|uniref:PepSY domain-containing protein n=1 Tax=Enemella sp. A6 TaxID=3440152 RepID=UPI003EB8148C